MRIPAITPITIPAIAPPVRPFEAGELDGGSLVGAPSLVGPRALGELGVGAPGAEGAPGIREGVEPGVGTPAAIGEEVTPGGLVGEGVGAEVTSGSTFSSMT